MKKIKLIVVSLCIGIISLFGTNINSYSISNITYTEGSTNLTGEKVTVKGIDEGSFHVLSTDGEKVRVFADFLVGSGYKYNSSSDGDVPVAFEDSMLYQGILDGTKTWKNDIETSGGKTNIFLVDAPTLDDLLNIGNFTDKGSAYPCSGSTSKYYSTDQTPDWLISFDHRTTSFLTKTTEDNGVYYLAYRNIYLYLSPTDNTYGGNIRPVLETSIYNLSSDNLEIQNYLNSVRAEIDKKAQNATNKNKDQNKTQVVKVPATGANASIIFTIVGILIILITGITIFLLVKNNKSKNK